MTSPQKPKNYWNERTCLKEARKYAKISDFENNSSAAYSAARRLGIYKECTSHMRSPQAHKNYWSKIMCISEAKKYDTITSFLSSNFYAYNKCLRKGWFEAFHHMKRQKSDADAFYLWSGRVGEKKIYKAGVTSARLGKNRMFECASSCRVEFLKEIFYIKSESAKTIEKFALDLGDKVHGIKGNGKTEFREYSKKDISKIFKFIYS